jgi:hypothetical protein
VVSVAMYWLHVLAMSEEPQRRTEDRHKEKQEEDRGVRKNGKNLCRGCGGRESASRA